ncbi:unnamed protein product, partial [Pelagomonas calceolata]
ILNSLGRGRTTRPDGGNIRWRREGGRRGESASGAVGRDHDELRGRSTPGSLLARRSTDLSHHTRQDPSAQPIHKANKIPQSALPIRRRTGQPRTGRRHCTPEL